jgi:hypothetical protein
MRLLSIIIILLLSLTNLQGQIEIALFFKNTCNNSITKLDFELMNLNIDKDNLQQNIKSDKGVAIVTIAGRYYLTSNVVWGDNMVGLFNQTIEVGDSPTQVDTIDIPAIKFTWDGVLHSKYWNYFKCDKLCDGIESDFYSNGKKRLEGEFKNGKPIHVVEYRNEYEKVNYFDESGMLKSYELYKISKRRTVKTTFTASGKRTGRDITKHNIDE